MSNANLNRAIKAKNDEFYTLYKDVKEGVDPYSQYFEGRSVFCNCNDGLESNYYKYFKDNFDSLGLTRLVCIGFEKGGNGTCIEVRKNEAGELYQSERKLEGDGDFRSEESVALLDELDIVVTNPPFSLFREFINLLESHHKKYLVLGNINTMFSKSIFPLIKEEKAWVVPGSGGMMFEVPEDKQKEQDGSLG